MGYPVKIDTNGSRPQIIRGLIQKELVDYIAMDIKTDPLHYSPLIKKDCDPDNIFSSIRIIMESGLPYEFKTTCVKPLVDDQVIRNICHIIQGAKLYALQRFRDTEVLHPEFFQENKSVCDADELSYFKHIAEPWVENCIVR